MSAADFRRDSRSLAASLPSDDSAASFSTALSDLQSGHDLLIVHSLEFFASVLSQPDCCVPADAFFLFLHHSQHPTSDDAQKLSLHCLCAYLESHPSSDADAICAPRFLEFLLSALSSADAAILNLALRLLAVAYSESEEARATLDGSGLWSALPSLPGLADLACGELICAGIVRGLMAAGEPTPLVAHLAGLLPVLLGSPVTANAAHALRCLERMIAEGFPLFDSVAVYAALPALIGGPPEVSASAFLVLPADADPAAPYFAAALAAMAGGSPHAVHYLRRTAAAWSRAPPPGMLSAVTAALRALAYAHAREALALLAPAIRPGEAEVALAEAAELAAEFAGDGGADAQRAAVAALLQIARTRVQAAGAAEWFLEAVAGAAQALEAIAVGGDERAAAGAQELLALLG